MTNLMTPAEVFPPGEFLRDELAERGWTEAEFADILGRPAQTVSEILNGKKEITTETALAIGAALGTSAELWLNLQSAYRLHIVRAHPGVAADVERRAALRGLVPVRELQKRGWLPNTKDVDVLELAVCGLLGIATSADRPTFSAAARRTNVGVELTPEQNAWTARVRGLGEARVTTPLDLAALASLAAEITARIHDPTDLALLADWLADVGVVLVVELALKGSKIDGVVVFRDDGVPIIGLSTRYDRMDSVVFTLLHEIAHLVLGHVSPGDVRLDECVLEDAATGPEAEANDHAARWVLSTVPEFGPGKPTMPQIIRAAQALGVHPCFVIGRLQRDGILDWKDYRRSVPKVRPFLRID